MLIDREKINKAKEKLGTDNALLMAEALKLEDFDERNLKACCCFHNENTPSLIYNPKNYTMHCFGCQKTVDIIDVFMLGGITYVEAVQKLFQLADVQHSFGELNVKTRHQYRYPNEVVCRSKEKVYNYLALRGIGKETVDYADVREDNNGNIVFNYYDTNNVLTMVKYRPARKIEKKEAKCWCQKDADTTHLLFNMSKINTSSPLLVTEGEIDTLTAIEAGYTNTCSVPLGAGNYQWIEENWDWLEQFDSIIICADNDEPGIKLQKEAIYRLGSWRTKFVEIPSMAKSKNGRMIPIKDLNEVLYYCGKEFVLGLILNAKDSLVDSVIDFADIKNVDLNEIDGILTGVKQIDKSLMKLFYGTFNILTGVNGSGKTSFISQLICQCLEQEKNVFYYSGEMSNIQTKNWINYIFAGQRNVKQYKYEDTVFWKVTPDAHKELADFYRGKLFIYKDSHSNKVSDLLKSMEDTTRKHGTKLLIIDNLTSVNLENNESNKYEKQAEFVNSLISFGKKYNVITVLVVHPHKLDTMRRMTKMDIQGISAIIDLAHRILSLYRVTAKDKEGISNKTGSGWIQEPIKHDVILDVLKDRMMGFEGESVGLYYDRPSRRFFASESDLDYKYSWDKNKYEGGLPFPPQQLIDSEYEIFGRIEV